MEHGYSACAVSVVVGLAGGDSESHRASSGPDFGIGAVDRRRAVERYRVAGVPRFAIGDFWRIVDHSRVVLDRCV